MEKRKIDFSRITRNEAAEAMGVHTQTVSRWVALGAPRNGDLTFDLPALINWAIDRAKETRPVDDASANESERWLTEYRKQRALIATLDREAREGQLIPKEQSIKWLSQIIWEAKSAFLSLPRRLPPVLYGKEPREIEGLLRSEIRSILERMARGSKRQQKGRKATG